MKMTTYKVRIFNPNIEKEIEVPIFESLTEAVEALTGEGALLIINNHVVTKARSQARDIMIKELNKK